MSRNPSIRKVAADFRRRARKLYAPTRRMRRIEEPKRWSRSFHVEIDESLSKRGFEFLGDFRLTRHRNAAAAPEDRRCVLLSANREIVALGSLLQLLPPRYWHSPMDRWPTLCLELITEFEDGGFLLTTNDEPTFMLALPPSVRRIEMPADTSMTRFLLRHRHELSLERKHGRRPRTIPDEAAMAASIRRYHLEECDFRRRINYLRPSEARALARFTRDLAAAATTMKAKYDWGPRERGEVPRLGRRK
jgi:hypothetical protein